MAWAVASQGYRNNSKYVEFMWRLFKYCQLWSSIIFKQFKIGLESYYQRCKCCPCKELVTRGGSPKGRFQMPNLLHLGAIFRAFPFSAFPLLSPLLSFTSPLSHFSQPFPFPNEINMKLSYRGQNAPNVVKHTNAKPTANRYCIYSYAV